MAANPSFEAMRKSTRMRLEIPVRIRSVDSAVKFDFVTTTVVVNAQGCALKSPSELPIGSRVELAMAGNVITGTVRNCIRADTEGKSWAAGVQLDRAGNFWGLPDPPADWSEFDDARNAGPELVTEKIQAASLVQSRPPAQADPGIAQPGETATPVGETGSGAPSEPSESGAASGANPAAGQLAIHVLRNTEETMSGLRVRVESLVAQQEADFAARCKVRQDEVLHLLATHSEKLSRLIADAERVLAQAEERSKGLDSAKHELALTEQAALEHIEARRENAAADLERSASRLTDDLKTIVTREQKQVESKSLQQKGAVDTAGANASDRLQTQLDQALHRIDAVFNQRSEQLKTGTPAQGIAEALRNQLLGESEVQKQKFTDEIAVLKAKQEQVTAEVAATALTLQKELASQSAKLAKELMEKVTAAISELRDQIMRSVEQALEKASTEASATAGTQQEQMSVAIASSEQRLREEMEGHAARVAATIQERVNASSSELRDQMMRDVERAAADAARRLQSQAEDQRAREQAENYNALLAKPADELLRETMERVRRELESQATAHRESVRKELDDAQQWLTNCTTEFRHSVETGFAEAGGEIRGRVHSAIAALQELIEQQLKQAQTQAAANADTVVAARVSDALERFGQDAERLTQSAGARWQRAIEQSLRSLPDLLRTHLDQQPPASPEKIEH